MGREQAGVGMTNHCYFSIGFVLEEVQGFIMRQPRKKKAFTNISRSEIEYFFYIYFYHIAGRCYQKEKPFF